MDIAPALPKLTTSTAGTTQATACSVATRRFSDSFSAKSTASDAARMNIVKLDGFWFDASTGEATVRFCGDVDLVRAALHTFQTW
jgi:hypothetical protein